MSFQAAIDGIRSVATARWVTGNRAAMVGQRSRSAGLSPPAASGHPMAAPERRIGATATRVGFSAGRQLKPDRLTGAGQSKVSEVKMDPAVSRRRMALFVFFFLPGVSMASWITRTPAIRDALDASIAQMGLVLLGLSFGSMTGILSAGPLVRNLGTRPVTRAGLWFIVASMVTIAAGVVVGNLLVVALGLTFFGLGIGMEEIAINIDGADVERITTRPFLHALHGCFSLGTVCGALVGMGLTSFAFPVAWHLAIIAVIDAVLILGFMRFVPEGTGRERRGAAGACMSAAEPNPRAAPLWTDGRLLLIALIVLAMALAEGAANDWLPILMVDEYGFSQASGSLVFVGFAAAMTVGRFGGGWFLGHFGRPAVIRASAVLGALGIAAVVFAGSPLVAGLAVVLWGLGASLGFPVALSAAGDSGPDAAARVKLVTIAGYIAFLVGPPMLGFVGESYGLRNAMLVVLAAVSVAAVIAPAVRARARISGCRGAARRRGGPSAGCAATAGSHMRQRPPPHGH